MQAMENVMELGDDGDAASEDGQPRRGRAGDGRCMDLGVGKVVVDARSARAL